MKRKNSDVSVLAQANEVLKQERELQRLMRLTFQLEFFKSLNEKYKQSPLHRMCCQHLRITRCSQVGSTIFEAGSTSDAFYVIVEGSVQVIYQAERERSNSGFSIKKQLVKGQYFGELGLLTASPRSATVINSDSTTTLAVLAASAFHKVFNPAIAEDLFASVYVKVLRNASFLSEWTNARLLTLATQVFLIDFKQAQKVLFRNGNQPHGTLFLLQGSVQIEVSSESCQELENTLMLLPGESINEEYLLENVSRAAYTSTCTSAHAKVLFMSNDHLLKFVMPDQQSYERLLSSIEGKQSRLIELEKSMNESQEKFETSTFVQIPAMVNQADAASNGEQQVESAVGQKNPFKLQLYSCSETKSKKQQGNSLGFRSAVNLDVSFSADIFLSNNESDKNNNISIQNSISSIPGSDFDPLNNQMNFSFSANTNSHLNTNKNSSTNRNTNKVNLKENLKVKIDSSDSRISHKENTMEFEQDMITSQEKRGVIDSSRKQLSQANKLNQLSKESEVPSYSEGSKQKKIKRILIMEKANQQSQIPHENNKEKQVMISSAALVPKTTIVSPLKTIVDLPASQQENQLFSGIQLKRSRFNSENNIKSSSNLITNSKKQIKCDESSEKDKSGIGLIPIRLFHPESNQISSEIIQVTTVGEVPSIGSAGMITEVEQPPRVIMMQRSHSANELTKKRSFKGPSTQHAQERILKRLFEGKKPMSAQLENSHSSKRALSTGMQNDINERTSHSSSISNRHSSSIFNLKANEKLPTIWSSQTPGEIPLKSLSQQRLVEKLNEKLTSVRDRFFQERESLVGRALTIVPAAVGATASSQNSSSHQSSSKEQSQQEFKVKQKRLIDYLLRAKSAQKSLGVTEPSTMQTSKDICEVEKSQQQQYQVQINKKEESTVKQEGGGVAAGPTPPNSSRLLNRQTATSQENKQQKRITSTPFGISQIVLSRRLTSPDLSYNSIITSGVSQSTELANNHVQTSQLQSRNKTPMEKETTKSLKQQQQQQQQQQLQSKQWLEQKSKSQEGGKKSSRYVSSLLGKQQGLQSSSKQQMMSSDESMNEVMSRFRKRNSRDGTTGNHRRNSMNSLLVKHSNSVETFHGRDNKSISSVSHNVPIVSFEPMLPQLLAEPSNKQQQHGFHSHLKQQPSAAPLLEQLQENRKNHGISNMKRIMYTQVKQFIKLKTSEDVRF